MSFRDKQARYQCYASRDKYWDCLDTVEPALLTKTQSLHNSTENQTEVLHTVKQVDAPSATVSLSTGHKGRYGASLQVNGDADADSSLKPCMELRKLCMQSCPEHWVCIRIILIEV